jgi:hypothetical protein
MLIRHSLSYYDGVGENDDRRAHGAVADALQI